MMLEPFPLDAIWFRLLVGVLTGLVLGSFTTMLSYRVPRKLSIILPGSHCPACQTPLTVRDLAPVLSWVVMRGRCRHCGVKISGRYPVIELVTAGLVTAAFVGCGFTGWLIVAVMGVVGVVTVITVRLER